MAKPLDITGVSTPMAETNTTLAPTDAEILGLNAGEVHFSETPSKYPEARHGTQYHAGAPGVLEFARAVLAKWGAPATASSEPVALPAGMPEPVGHFINVNEPGAPKYEQVSPEYADDSDAVALYTTAQVQDMLAQGLAAQPLPQERKPMTQTEINSMVNAISSYTGDYEDAIVRAVEKHHGITAQQGGGA